MNFTEQAFCFDCVGETLLGIVAMPEEPAQTGVLVVVGGPQYRIGSHRQFLLLSRGLASAGYAVMRFDVRGMGDSSGAQRGFDTLQNDIGAAIRAFQQHCPTIKRIVLWGLCDAASANLMYWDATEDERISGLVLLNPWVRSEITLAKAHIRHYYGRRLFQVEFWRKLFAGQLGIARALGDFGKNLHASWQQPAGDAPTFQLKMSRAMRRFSGPVLVILSGDDYTAKEYLEAVRSDVFWSGIPARGNIRHITLEGADHTFSSTDLRQQVEAMTQGWLLEHATVMKMPVLPVLNRAVGEGNAITNCGATYLLTPTVFLGAVESVQAGREHCSGKDPHLTLDWFALLVKTALPSNVKLILAPASRRLMSEKSFLPLMVMPDQAGKIVSLSNFYTPIFGLVNEASADHECIETLATQLRFAKLGYDSAQFSPMDPESRSFQLLNQGFRKGGWLVDDYFCFGNWYEKVEPGNYEAYLAARPSRLRNTLRRAQKRFANEDSFILSITQHENENLEAAIANFVSVYELSWKEPEPYPKFIPELCRLAARQGSLRLGQILHNNKAIAAQIWLVSGRKAYIIKLAYDQRHVRASAGTLLTAALFRHVIEIDRVEEVDYLIGDDDYKRDWMTQRRERRGIIAFNLGELAGWCKATMHYAGKLWRLLKAT